MSNNMVNQTSGFADYSVQQTQGATNFASEPVHQETFGQGVASALNHLEPVAKSVAAYSKDSADSKTRENYYFEQVFEPALAHAQANNFTEEQTAQFVWDTGERWSKLNKIGPETHQGYFEKAMGGPAPAQVKYAISLQNMKDIEKAKTKAKTEAMLAPMTGATEAAKEYNKKTTETAFKVAEYLPNGGAQNPNNISAAKEW